MSQLLLASRPARSTRRPHTAARRAVSAGRAPEVDGMLRDLAFVYRLAERIKAEIGADKSSPSFAG